VTGLDGIFYEIMIVKGILKTWSAGNLPKNDHKYSKKAALGRFTFINENIFMFFKILFFLWLKVRAFEHSAVLHRTWSPKVI
jgi:hypothetical protein